MLEGLDELVLHAVEPFVLIRGDGWSFDRRVLTQGSDDGHGRSRSCSELIRLADSLLAGEQVALPNDARVVVSQGWGRERARPEPE